MTVTIVDYDGGNLRSVQRACDAVGIRSEFSRDPDALRRAERIIFPGVGNAESAMRTLIDTGVGDALREAHRQGIPILGICVGAQLILERSEESSIPCLGLIEGATVRFQPKGQPLKVPHIGWNEVRACQAHFLFEELEPGDEFYFVHSFYPSPADASNVYGTTEYGGTFCCALGRDNLFATQFHPEKSGRLGLRLLTRFCSWKP